MQLGRELLYLTQADVEAVGLTMAEIIAALESAFREKGEGRVETPAKIGVHSQPDAFTHALPASIPAQKAVGMKWVAGYPANSKRGLPYVTGLLILNDFETGLPLAVMDCVWITAKRTGAATAVSAEYLASPESQSVGILGCGVQGRSNLEALKATFPIKKSLAYDTHSERSASFAKEMSQQLQIEVIPVSDPKQAVTGCDIVVTAGPILRKPHATIQPNWLAEGAFASLIDFDSYWHPSALHQTSKFCTDDVPQLATLPRPRLLSGYSCHPRRSGGTRYGPQARTRKCSTTNDRLQSWSRARRHRGCAAHLRPRNRAGNRKMAATLTRRPA